LPPFEEYDMKGRTYRYFEGDPLYPFGYGLSYTTFVYSNLMVEDTISTVNPLSVSVDVENTGQYDGDEVVQIYLKHVDASVPVPIHALVSFKRIHLNKGEKKTVALALDPSCLSVINDKNQRIVFPGNIIIYAGGGQPGEKNITSGKILDKTIVISGKENVIEQLNK
jgi:beta-glucosidase